MFTTLWGGQIIEKMEKHEVKFGFSDLLVDSGKD